MNTLVEKPICLKLNKEWQAINFETVKKVLSDLAAGNSIYALDLEYELDSEGNPIKMINATPVDWDTWIKLPVRPYDLGIPTPKKLIRCPIVVVTKNYSKIHMKKWKDTPSRKAVYERDNGIDQYSGLPLSYSDATLDHILPLSRGGKDTWENVVSTSRKTNSKKGSKTNKEAGLKLIKDPKKPKPIPVNEFIKKMKPRHRDWKFFLEN